jgi:hypothetical protein
MTQIKRTLARQEQMQLRLVHGDKQKKARYRERASNYFLGGE